MNFLNIWPQIRAAALAYVGQALYGWFVSQQTLSDEDLAAVLDGFKAAYDADIAAQSDV